MLLFFVYLTTICCIMEVKGCGCVLPKRLKQLRHEKGVYQKDVAKYLCITTSAYGYYEQGERQPDPNTITKLAERLDPLFPEKILLETQADV